MFQDLKVFVGESTLNMQDAADQARASFMNWAENGEGEGATMEISTAMQFGQAVDQYGSGVSKSVFTITVILIADDSPSLN